jgi:lactate dehydrogenase-like 2-hydroxyacid dehydrogenase
MSGGDTAAVRIAATQQLPGPAWSELPDLELLETWPPTRPLPGVEVLVAVVVRVGTEELDLLPDLRLVANYGAGYDTVDVAACRERGSADEYPRRPRCGRRRPHARADPGLRGVAAGASSARAAGSAGGPAELLGHDLAGSTLGLVGLGRIGSSPASRRRSECASSSTAAAAGCHSTSSCAPPSRLSTSADAETRGLVSRDGSHFSATATLVNTARGTIVDDTLSWRSSSPATSPQGSTCSPPSRTCEPLLGLPNVVLTPHIASATVETRAAMTRVLVDNVLAFVRGEPLLTPVDR